MCILCREYYSSFTVVNVMMRMLRMLALDYFDYIGSGKYD